MGYGIGWIYAYGYDDTPEALGFITISPDQYIDTGTAQLADQCHRALRLVCIRSKRIHYSMGISWFHYGRIRFAYSDVEFPVDVGRHCYRHCVYCFCIGTA